MVACDNVYNLPYYGQDFPPHPLFFYDDPAKPQYKGGNIASNESFSKILSPALRFGWMECSYRIAKIFRSSGILYSSGAVNHYVSGVITSLLQLKIEDNYLDKLVEVYRERLSVLCNVLNHYFPQCCSSNRPEGDYFVWIHLPLSTCTESSDFVKWCQGMHKVSAIPGIQFSYSRKCFNFLRLTIGFHNKDILNAAAKTFCQALLNYVRKDCK